MKDILCINYLLLQCSLNKMDDNKALLQLQVLVLILNYFSIQCNFINQEEYNRYNLSDNIYQNKLQDCKLASVFIYQDKLCNLMDSLCIQDNKFNCMLHITMQCQLDNILTGMFCINSYFRMIHMNYHNKYYLFFYVWIYIQNNNNLLVHCMYRKINYNLCTN